MNNTLNNDFFSFWKNLSSTKTIQSYQMIQRAIILSYDPEQSIDENAQSAKNKILKSFTPITNKNKIVNGAYPWEGLRTAFMMTRHKEPCLFEKFASDDSIKGKYVLVRDRLVQGFNQRNGFANQYFAKEIK